MYPHVYKRKKHNTLRNTVITVVLLVVISVIAGVLYVYFTGKNPPVKHTKVDATPEVRAPKHVMPSANVPQFAALESLVSPVPAGSNTSMNVRALPFSKCTIEVSYSDVKSKDSGLVTKTTDDFGFVGWTWTVDKTAPAGTWPVKVMCYKGKKSALLIGNLKVTK